MTPSNPRSKTDQSEERPPACEVTFITGGQAFQGSSTHFDETGMLILCPTPLPVNVKIELVLRFSRPERPIKLRGEVVWSNIFGPDDPITPRAMGVKFLSVESATSRLLAELSQRYLVYGDQYRCYYR